MPRKKKEIKKEKKTMAFQLPKSVNDIEQGKLLEPGLYRMRIVKEPSIEPNRKKKDGLSPEEGAGDNLVLKLRVISDDPSENGRAFTKWLPMPRPGIDEELTDAFTGQPMLDRKMEAIVTWVQAFGGELDDDQFDLPAGLEAYVPVSQESFERDGEQTIVNSIDMNSIPVPIE